MSTVFMFSGQGSQYYQMGADLYQHNAVFKKYLTALDERVHEVIGKSVLGEILSPEKNLSDSLDDPSISGLSIYMIELAMVKTLADSGVYPDILLGSSFGTLVASVVAGCVTEEEAITYLAKHGAVFNDTCEKGCMLGVLASADRYRDSPPLQNLAELAGVNFSSSCVLSLPENHLREVKAILNDMDITFQPLPVSRAYHSHWIETAKDSFFALYSTLNFRSPTIPIICTSSTQPLSLVNAAVFWRAIRSPMLFHDTIEHLEECGPHHYIDIGPSGTLATFIKYSLPSHSQSSFFPILSPFKQGVKGFERVVSIAHR